MFRSLWAYVLAFLAAVGSAWALLVKQVSGVSVASGANVSRDVSFPWQGGNLGSYEGWTAQSRSGGDLLRRGN